GAEVRVAIDRLGRVVGLVPGGELLHPREQLAKGAERAQVLPGAGRAMTDRGAFEGDEGDQVSLAHGSEPFRHAGTLVAAQRSVPGQDVACKMDSELSHARVGEVARFVVGEPEARLREGAGRAGERDGRQAGEQSSRSRDPSLRSHPTGSLAKGLPYP